ncbi:MAG TPA: general secretion pathway protein GspB [Roseimicrobium sp.]|nr:general secretion pathway protein GspB [Roseimicrobium sp.]
MSLINDALKRANKAQQRQGSTPPPPPNGPLGVPLQPVEPMRRPSGGGPSFMLAVVGVVFLLVGAIWFTAAWWHHRTPAPSGQSTQPVTVSPVASATAPAPTPIVPVTTPSTSSKPAIKVNTNLVSRTEVIAVPVAKAAPEVVVAVAEPAPVEKPVVVEPVVAAPAPAPAFPNLKLQGIFYRLSKPSAIINGKTLFAGDFIDGVKVVKIERQHVVLDFKGEQKVLNL